MVALFPEMEKTQRGRVGVQVGSQVLRLGHAVSGFNQRVKAEASGILEQGSVPFLRHHSPSKNSPGSMLAVTETELVNKRHEETRRWEASRRHWGL